MPSCHCRYRRWMDRPGNAFQAITCLIKVCDSIEVVIDSKSDTVRITKLVSDHNIVSCKGAIGKVALIIWFKINHISAMNTGTRQNEYHERNT